MTKNAFFLLVGAGGNVGRERDVQSFLFIFPIDPCIPVVFWLHETDDREKN